MPGSKNRIMRRAHVLAMCCFRNSAWHRLRNITLIDRFSDGMTYGRQRVGASGWEWREKGEKETDGGVWWQEAKKRDLECCKMKATQQGRSEKSQRKRHQIKVPGSASCTTQRQMTQRCIRLSARRSRVSWGVKGTSERGAGAGEVAEIRISGFSN